LEITNSKLPDNEKQLIINELPNIYKNNMQEKPNLTKKEHQQLQQIKNNPNIIIKPTDKNMGIAVIEINLYKKLVETHLNCNHYEPLTSDPTKTTINNIQKLLEKLTTTNEITKKLANKLQPPDTPRIGLFYGLPKLHKPNLTIRPIISNINHPTSNISRWLHQIMLPIATNAKSYINNSYNLINDLKNIYTTNNSFIITADIESLYTNIPNKEGASIATQECYKDNQLKPPINQNTFHQLLLQVLENNIFEYNNQHYIQKIGTAMGTIMAPTYANTVLKNLEERHLLNNHNQKHLTKNIQIFRRYIDDIFIIYDNTDNSLPSLLKQLKKTYAPLKLNIKFGKTQTFLDINLKINNITNKIETEIYRKPLGSNQIINPTSNHPKHTIENTITQEFARIYKLCTNPTDTFKNISKLINTLRKNNYTQKDIDKAHTKALKYQNNIQTKKQNKQQDKEKIVLTHNNLTQKIKHLLTNTNTNPMICYKTLPNIKKQLVRAKMKLNHNQTITTTTTTTKRIKQPTQTFITQYITKK
jgi:hypothetical protein